MVVIFLSIFFSIPSWSASIKISPMKLELTKESDIAILKLTNASDEPVVLQMEAKEWSQDDGNDVTKPTKDIIISPPLAKIQPQELQILRLAIRKNTNKNQEVAYRLFLNEIPQPSSTPKQGIQTVLSISLPLFIKPSSSIQLSPVWSVDRVGKNELRVGLQNRGNEHMKVTKVAIHANKGCKPIVEKEVLDYILPLQKKGWNLVLPTSLKNRELLVSVETESGKISESIQLPPA